jgi:hypothetical protein
MIVSAVVVVVAVGASSRAFTVFTEDKAHFG